MEKGNEKVSKKNKKTLIGLGPNSHRVMILGQSCQIPSPHGNHSQLGAVSIIEFQLYQH